MIRTKLGLLGLCAIVLGMMAMSASSAQAAFSWLILDKDSEGRVTNNLEIVKVGEGVNLLASLTGEIDTPHPTLLTELVGLKVAISCTGFSVKNVHLAPEGKLTEGGKVVFTGCQAFKEKALGENLGCTVKSPGAGAGTVETNEGKGELVLNGSGELLTKIEPKTGTEFASLRLEGCALTEVNPVRGVLFIKDCEPPATTHRLRHLIEEGPGTALYLGAHSAKKLETTKLDGSGWVKLGGDHVGLLWGPMDA